MKNVGFKTVIRLYEQFGSVQKAWEATDKEIYRIFPPLSEQAKAFIMGRNRKNALKESWINILRGENIQIFKYADKEYPTCLKELQSPPIILYCKGNIDLLKNLGCAVIGTRNPSKEGCKKAEIIGIEIAKNNIPHISGLATGIDSCGHKGALEGEGRSIGVLGSGLLKVFPEENVKLAQKIISKKGLLISESPPHYPVSPFQLRNRNRIIAALSRMVVIVEATKNSGSLIAARHAKELKREIYVLGPINPTEKLHQGLIRILDRGNAVEHKLDELILQMFAKDTIKPDIINKLGKKDAVSDTLHTEDEYVFEILRAIANSPLVRKKRIKYLSKLKIHKICFKIIESLGLNVTRSWYLRGCYVHNDNIEKKILLNLINTTSSIPSIFNNIEKTLDNLLKTENILYTQINTYLKKLYEKDAPERYKKIYILNQKIQEILEDFDKSAKEAKLSDWGVIIEKRDKNVNIVEDFISACHNLEYIKPYTDRIKKILELLFNYHQEILKSTKIKSLGKLYFDSIWKLIASNISINTLHGPRKHEISMELLNRVINNAEEILTDTYSRIEDSINNF